MSLPITIEGHKYFVTMPSLADFRSYKQFLAHEMRREMGESIPSGLPDEELKRRYRLIAEEVDGIDPFSKSTNAQLLKSNDGRALLFYSWLRHESPGLSLDWVAGLLARCEDGSAAALEGMKELRNAMESLIEQKKSEFEAKRAAQQPPPETPPPTSTPSTSG